MINTTYYYPILYKPSPKETFKQALEKRLNREFAGASVSDCVLILTSYTFYLSPEEVLTFYPFFSYHTLYKSLSLLAKKKLLIGDTLYHGPKAAGDGRTKTVYSLTKSGFAYVKEKYRPELTDNMYRKYSKRFGVHDYSLGWNFFSMISNPLLPPVSHTHSELVFGENGKKVLIAQNDLRIDGKIQICGDTVYVEQDMCKETNEYLRNKFNRYGFNSLNLSSKDSCILLSIKKPFVSLTDNADIKHGKNVRFSEKYLSSVQKLMRENSGILKGNLFSDLHSRIVDGTIPHSSLTELAEALWAECEHMYYCDANDTSEKPDIKLTTGKYIEYHMNRLATFRDNMYFYEYNKVQEDAYIRKRNALVDNILSSGLYSKSQSTDTLPYDTRQYLYGYNLFIGPTSMIDKVCFFILYKHTAFKGIMENTLLQYFPNFDRNSYKDTYTFNMESPYRKKNARKYTFALRNYYNCTRLRSDGSIHDKDRFICIENLAYDVSASVRVKAAVESITSEKQEGRQGIVLVCLVRNQEEAKYFYDLLDMKSVPLDGRFNIGFIDICNVFSVLSDDHFDIPGILLPDTAPLYALYPSGASVRYQLSKTTMKNKNQ